LTHDDHHAAAARRYAELEPRLLRRGFCPAGIAAWAGAELTGCPPEPVVFPIEYIHESLGMDAAADAYMKAVDEVIREVHQDGQPGPGDQADAPDGGA
jgi:hypothetical protein